MNGLLKLSVSVSLVLGLAACSSDVATEQNQAAVAQQQQSAPESLLDAVKSNNVEVVKALLAAGADPNEAEPDGSTLLMWAIQSRNTELAETLLAAGADVLPTNRRGVTALYLAARNGDADIARQLLAQGADANSSLPEGETVLMTAAKAGNAELVRLLLGEAESTGVAGLDNKADVNAREGWHGQTALMWAAATGRVEALQVLIDAGATLDEHSQLIDAPEPNPDRLQGGFVYPKIPKGRFTALHFAAREGQLEAVQTLIAAGADLDAVDEEGTNALVLATINGHLDVAGLLLEAGADPNVTDSWGRTVLFVATDLNTIDAHPRPAPKLVSRLSPVDIVKLALERGADPNVELKMGLPSYLSQGAAQNPVLNKGATPFLRAAMSGDLELIDILLDAGADPLKGTAEREPMKMAGMEFPSNGNTSTLMAAAGVGWRESLSRGRETDAVAVIDMLLKLGADINAANQSGDTALHGATLRGSTVLIRHLVDKGADLMATNARGWTPLDIALGQPDERIAPNDETAALLRELGGRSGVTVAASDNSTAL